MSQKNQSIILFQKKILAWQTKQGRHDLPWQKNPSLYRVWISEIMLQQTQVATVIPYYERFMREFPSISLLAKAPLDQVLHLWSGLGYYARARYLHQAAQQIESQYQGQFPTVFEDVIQLAGIGRSTAGAILSLADHQIYPILDGNVRRIYCRYFIVKGWFGHKKVQDQLWDIATQFLSQNKPAQFNQALMDLGATICTSRQMACQKCPLNSDCKAYQTKTQLDYPTKKPKKKRPEKSIIMLVIINKKNQVLLEKRPAIGIWGGLWSFPEIKDASALQNWFIRYCQSYDYKKITQLKIRYHQFTHFQLAIEPQLFLLQSEIKQVREEKAAWYDLEQPIEKGLATPISQILTEIKEQLL